MYQVPCSQFVLTVGFKGLTEKGNREFAAPGEIVTECYTQPAARNEVFPLVCISVLLNNSRLFPGFIVVRSMNFALYLAGTEQKSCVLFVVSIHTY